MKTIERPDDVEALQRRVAKLERINAALMDHVERATDRQANAYSLFQTAITLDARVRSRTQELVNLMRSVERSNQALTEAKEEAERANRSKTKFLAAASHDLLQPLNASRLSISTLRDMEIGREALAIAGQVERGLTTIEELIKALIDISKLDAGVLRPNVHAVDLNELIDDVLESFEPMAARKNLRLTGRADVLAVESDPIMLRRILQNLVSNAVRYTKRGGVRVRARQRAGLCVVDVVDTGPGIGKADCARMFDEFYRGETSSDSDPGLGLGLSIVKRMTLALGHGLMVSSRPGRGSRFRLRLAMAQGAARPRGAQPTPFLGAPTAVAGGLVVVVENDTAAREALCRLLASWEADVVGARDLAELRKALVSADAPRVAVLDYHLDNGECGLDAADWLRARYGTALPVIVSTADHTAEVAARIQQAGAELIHKPMKPAQLRALISHLVGPARAA
ncbi:MAG: hybrid sensor histidine kinase/response regulator [Ancylobacter novellus]|uniref:histidine kinase n=1 Tax=Ancylobacter novellus TaxID=921 RepID=A0A2W5KBW7_ANCNO|nr:MAG: hybrid sensor histidine kinase/response regulator [Ancylobacter novellus]